MAILTLSVPRFTDDDLNDEKQRRRIMNYLIRLDEQLRFVLSNLDSDNFTDGFKAEIIDAVSGDRTADVTIKELESEIGRLRTQITQAYDRIELKADAEELDALGQTVATHTAELTVMAGSIKSKVSRTEFDALGQTVESHSTQITQTAERLEAVAEQVGGGDQIMAEIADGEKTLSGSYASVASVTLADAGIEAGDQLTWSVYVTPSVQKNVGLNVYYGAGHDYYSETVLIAANTEQLLEYTTEVPEGATTIGLYFHDQSSDTTSTSAEIAYRDCVLKIKSGADYVTRAEFEMTAQDIRLQVSQKADGDASGNATSVKTAGMEINANGVYVTGGEISMTTSDGEEYVNISGEGVSASSMSAPNVAARYDGPDVIYVNPSATDAQVGTGEYVRGLQAAISRVNGKCLDRDVEIRMGSNVTTYGDIELRGVHGGGGLTILGSNASTCILNGRLSITNCYTLIRVDGMSIITTSGNAVTVKGSPDVFFWNDVMKSSSGTGLSVTMGGGALVNASVLSGGTYAASVTLGGKGVFMNTTGSGKLSCTLGMMLASGTVPSGGVEWINAFEPNNKSGLTTDGTGSSSTAVSTTAATYDLAHSDYYAGGWRFTDDNDLRQGYLSGRQLYGCMWFDSLSGITGRSIKEATLRLHRDGDYGRGGSVSVYLRGLTTAYSTSMGSPSLSGDYGLIGTIQPGETLELTVPTAAITALANGTIKGLALYTGETSYYKTYQYSRNYARFDGETSGTEETKPRLTVVYG